MTDPAPAAVALCALAVLCAPSRDRPARLRLVALLGRSTGHTIPARLPAVLTGAGRRRCIAAAAATVGVGLLAVVPVLPALCGAVIAGLLVHLEWTRRSGREVAQGEGAAAECAAALAAELRAGHPPDQALTSVGEHAAPTLQPVLRAAARTAALGGDTAGVFRLAARQSGAGRPGAGQSGTRDLRRIAAGWSLSQSSGCSLALVLEAVQRDLAARDQHRRLLSGLLAGPRATAGLLAVLPALGLAMGSALGARPWHVLTATWAGQLALTAGVVLDAAGVLWTARLVRAAGGV